MIKNQTKVFIAIIRGYEHCDILGVNSSLDDAWKRHEKQADQPDAWRSVIEAPIDSKINFSPYGKGDRHGNHNGYKVHDNPIKDGEK